MITKKDYPQGSDEWIKERMLNFTSTDCRLMGAGKYASVFFGKRYGYNPTGDHLNRGLERESFILELLNKSFDELNFGYKAVQSKGFYVNEILAWATSPDGDVARTDGKPMLRKIGVEVKNPSTRATVRMKDWRNQCKHAMKTRLFDGWVLAYYIEDEQYFDWEFVKRDDEGIEEYYKLFLELMNNPREFFLAHPVTGSELEIMAQYEDFKDIHDAIVNNKMSEGLPAISTLGEVEVVGDLDKFLFNAKTLLENSSSVEQNEKGKDVIVVKPITNDDELKETKILLKDFSRTEKGIKKGLVPVLDFLIEQIKSKIPLLVELEEIRAKAGSVKYKLEQAAKAYNDSKSDMEAIESKEAIRCLVWTGDNLKELREEFDDIAVLGVDEIFNDCLLINPMVGDKAQNKGLTISIGQSAFYEKRASGNFWAIRENDDSKKI